ncbi:MAG TPA: hypothetical protein VFL67_12485 [Mycobacterium sp.]|nr:hypothetical protein [Mycobacterium sp.]
MSCAHREGSNVVQRWGLMHQDGGMRSTSWNVWSSAMRAGLTAQGQSTADDLTGRFG